MDINPIAIDTEPMYINETMYQILEEVRSMKEQFERSSEENKTLLETLGDEVKKLRSEIKEMKMYADPEFKFLPNMPFELLSDLREFDEKLLEDDAMRSELKSFIRRFVGKDFPSFLRTVLRAVVTDELAVNLTWRGTPEKPSVQTFTVFVIIRDICYAKFSNSTHADINRICQQHFLHAKDRVLKRQRLSGYSSSVSSSIKRSVSPSSSPPPQPSPPPPSHHLFNLPPLPITTLASLEEFDEKLMADIKLKTELKKYVNSINGLDYSVFLRAAFRALLTDNVAMEMTWRGTKEKPSIQDFKIFDIIKATCRKKFTEASEADINRVCQQHFLHAKDRVSKKIKLF